MQLIIVFVVIFVVFLVVLMALPVPNYGSATPCQPCADREDPQGVYHWSAVARHFPDHRAATMHEMIRWMRRMSQARGTCSECARVLNMVAIECATIISNL